MQLTTAHPFQRRGQFQSGDKQVDPKLRVNEIKHSQHTKSLHEIEYSVELQRFAEDLSDKLHHAVQPTQC